MEDEQEGGGRLLPPVYAEAAEKADGLRKARAEAEARFVADIGERERDVATRVLWWHVLATKLFEAANELGDRGLVTAYITVRSMVMEKLGPRPVDVDAEDHKKAGDWAFLDATGMLPWFKPVPILCPVCGQGQPFRYGYCERYECTRSKSGCSMVTGLAEMQEMLGVPVRSVLGYLARAEAFEGIGLDG